MKSPKVDPHRNGSTKAPNSIKSFSTNGPKMTIHMERTRKLLSLPCIIHKN